MRSRIEVLTTIRASGPNQETPVFLCTAKTHELDIDRLSSSLKVTGVFHKPFSPKELVVQLKTACLSVYSQNS